MSLLERFKISLAKTRATITATFVSPRWEAAEMERALVAADFGPRLAAELVERVREDLALRPRATREEAFAAAHARIVALLRDGPSSPPPPREGTEVWLLVGVNGAGKTTTLAKLAARLRGDGGRVLLAAGDTFRAAAVEQLKAWGERLGIETVAGAPGADPAAVAHDAVRRAVAGGFRHLLVDTAGRQHTRHNLMQELIKIRRVIGKVLPGAPHETLLVMDAPTGMNGIAQAREFHAAVGLTGVVVTKLDGTARGGVVVAICKETGVPIRFVGMGEKVEDLDVFDAANYADALLPSASDGGRPTARS
ncbi:MAG: signal recognition particle-docking protein FtsY [Verrucomicrobiae bacterium]|nr:signal recognition particle-docking protein FtsY [Verrucomicrobiae bacterium]